MLESLRHGAGTIHELNLAGAFPERAPYRPRELYAALKATPLFDVERGQWNWVMKAEQLPGPTFRETKAQLFGVLAEGQFNLERAQVLFEELKTTPLYDNEHGWWNMWMSEEQILGGSYRGCASAQLSAVLVQAQFDPEGARERYEGLKATQFYDAEDEQWCEDVPDHVPYLERSACALLLGVLLEAQFSPRGARELYEKAKASPLYDAERELWNGYMSKAQELASTDRYAGDQLLAVLVEAQVNPEGAPVLYEKLKSTPLYDRECGQWNGWMSEEQILKDTNRYTIAQLLGVVVEAKLASIVPCALVEAVPPLPIMKAW